MNTEQNNQFKSIVLTGDRPTGPLHLGHYVGSMKNRLKFQDEYDTCFYIVPDVQALTDNADNPQKVRNNVMEIVLDNLAVGMNPKKTHIFIQSMVPEIAELTIFFMNLVTVQQLAHNPTIKAESEQKGYLINSRIDDSNVSEVLAETVEVNKSNKIDGNVKVLKGMPFGFLGYPVSQAADILFAKANIVPVGDDQLPHLEQANDIAKKFNATYGQEIFPKIKGIVGEVARLVGTDGNAKASKSLGNAIYLKDSPEEIERKVMSMYTDPNRIKKTDAGQVEGNVVFTYLDTFARTETLPLIADLKKRYTAGGEDAPGDVEVKKLLIQELRALLDPIRARREAFAKDMPAVEQILKDGIAVARQHAQVTMAEVRKAMRIDYF